MRTIDALYDLQDAYVQHFSTLNDLAAVARGVTTNCDDFFIVSDVTQAALERHQIATAFQAAFGVRRSEVQNGRYKIVRRDDGVELPLEPEILVPTLKTARDIYDRCTTAIENDGLAVQISSAHQNTLSRVTQDYIAAGEREHWQDSSSFNGRTDWYILRESTPAPILFVKTIQYAPVVFWNDANFIANQRLYKINSRRDVDAEVLAAVLNSTVFAAERFAGVKALGREAANDVEVFTARQYRIVDVRRLSAADQRALRDAFRRLRRRAVGHLLEETIAEAGLAEAKVYAEQNFVTPALWPAELQDVDRQEIDLILLKSFGMNDSEATSARSRLYNELTSFMRRAKLLELEAQANRRGAGGDGPGISTLSDDVWADLTANSQADVRTLPDDFLPDNIQTKTMILPPGRVAQLPANLFGADEEHVLRFGRDTIVEF